MSFISKLIPGKKIIIIDVGTYKVKVAYCEYKNGDITIISYGEKKQEKSDIIGTEIANIQGVSSTIDKSIKKILLKFNHNPKDIIINIPTSSIISSGKTINYLRENSEEHIDLNELDHIIGKIESFALVSAKKDIGKKTGFNDIDMKLITSSITDINIDGFKVSNPIGFTGREVNISTLNIFIPNSRYNILQTISNFLNKNILSIIPLEFSLPKLVEYGIGENEDVIIIDIGNTKTSVIIQKKGVILGFDRIDIGINDLIKIIQTNSNETSIEIINNIQKQEKYIKEKQDFFGVWEEGLIITIKEILKSSLVPDKIFLSGGGDNSFLREGILNINLNKYSLHSLKSFSFLEIDFKNELNIKGDKKIFDKTNYGILSMILATREIINYKNSPVFSILKDFIEKNEF